MQEEVEKTLSDLLTRMEPWSSSREVKGEAGRILQEQRKLQAEAAELEKKLPLGKTPEELTEAQRAELDNLADSQKRLEERTNQLLAKMQRMAEERKDKDPDGAHDLKDALDEARKDDLSGDMQKADKELGRNQLSDAQADQKAASAELQKMVKGFEEKREDDLDRLAKKLAEKQKELEELRKGTGRVAEEDRGGGEGQGRKGAGTSGEAAEEAGPEDEGHGGAADAAGGGAGRPVGGAGRRGDGPGGGPAGEGPEAGGRGRRPGPIGRREKRGGPGQAGRRGRTGAASSRPASPRRCSVSRSGRRV